MAHTLVGNTKVLNRVRRLRGQVDAIERALSADAPCGDLMRLIAATRGAINGIMAEVVNEHIQTHMIDEARTPLIISGPAFSDIRRYARQGG